MRTAEEIIKDIDNVDTMMIKGCYQAGRGDIDTISLRKQRESLENELCLARSVLVASNDELDIYEQRKYKEHYAKGGHLGVRGGSRRKSLLRY